MNAAHAIEMHGIVKRFGNFCALDEVELEVKKGSIHAILGENGAGKTTLMNILYGLYDYNKGQILVHGKEVHFKSPRDAIHAGIGMVHQHFKLIEPYTVLQNIVLGYEKKGLFGFIDYRKARKEIEALIKAYHFKIDLDAKVRDISVGMQQRVEIVKALYRGADILIFDEPTAVLTPQEIHELTGCMKNMTEEGKTVIIITHKLEEITQCASRCTIIRRGKFITEVAVDGCDTKKLASLMVGREVNFSVKKQKKAGTEPMFEIRNLTVEDRQGICRLSDLSLEVHHGEIVGIAGVDGNGQQELFEAISSLIMVKSGTITIHSKEIQNTDPKTMLENGITVIPEDRQKDGLVLNFTVAENLISQNLSAPQFSRHGFLKKPEIMASSAALIEKYDIRPSGCSALKCRALSGGNQQKVIIARAIARNPDLIIAVQPTRGMDVGAIEFVHKALIEEREKGKGILLISLDLDEILKLSDRVAIISSGHITGVFDAQDADKGKIGTLMVGGKN